MAVLLVSLLLLYIGVMLLHDSSQAGRARRSVRRIRWYAFKARLLMRLAKLRSVVRRL